MANAADLSGMVDYLTELGIKHNRYGAEDEYFDVSISIHDAVKSRNHWRKREERTTDSLLK